MSVGMAVFLAACGLAVCGWSGFALLWVARLWGDRPISQSLLALIRPCAGAGFVLLAGGVFTSAGSVLYWSLTWAGIGVIVLGVVAAGVGLVLAERDRMRDNKDREVLGVPGMPVAAWVVGLAVCVVPVGVMFFGPFVMEAILTAAGLANSWTAAYVAFGVWGVLVVVAAIWAFVVFTRHRHRVRRAVRTQKAAAWEDDEVRRSQIEAEPIWFPQFVTGWRSGRRQVRTGVLTRLGALVTAVLGTLVVIALSVVLVSAMLRSLPDDLVMVVPGMVLSVVAVPVMTVWFFGSRTLGVVAGAAWQAIVGPPGSGQGASTPTPHR